MNVHLLSFNPYISRINYQHKNKIAFERKKLFIKRCINKNLEKLSLLKVSFFDIQSKCGIRQEKYVYKSNENKHLIESSSKLNEKITFSTQMRSQSYSRESLLLKNITSEQENINDYLKSTSKVCTANKAEVNALHSKYLEQFKRINASDNLDLKKIKHFSKTSEFITFNLGFDSAVPPAKNFEMALHSCNQQSRYLAVESDELNEVFECSQMQSNAKQEEINTKEGHLANVENIYRTKRNETDDFVTELLLKIKDSEGQLKKIQNTNKTFVQKTDNILQRLQHEYKDFIQICLNDKCQAQRHLLTSLDALMLHKQGLQDSLKS